MKIELLPVPYDSARRGDRMGGGPLHLLKSGLAARLAEDGHSVTLQFVELPPGFRATEIAGTFELAAAVARRVAHALEAGAFPLVLSGNCGPAALGCVGALQGATDVFWFDAHGDFNTPETTRSGFLDGMALAVVTGRCWAGLASAIPGFTPVIDSKVTTIGVRHLDEDEAVALQASGVKRVGIPSVRADLPTTRSERQPRAGVPAYVHLDLDVLDPIAGRMNEFASPGGLGADELKWCLAQIANSHTIRAASVTAYDPAADATGQAVRSATGAIVALAAAVAASSQR